MGIICKFALAFKKALILDFVEIIEY